MQLPGQVSSDGTTKPVPLPDRVGAKHNTCSGPSWRRYAGASTIGASMMVVDAINERAAAFYEGNGFVRLPDSLRLVLPMDVIKRLVKP